jgi:putative hydrolase of the HAD superfamily
MKNFWDNINLDGIKGVLLDLDDTIYEYQVCHDYAMERCYGEFKKIKKDFSFDDFRIGYKQAQESVKKYLSTQGSGHSRLLYFQVFFENFFGRTEIKMTEKFESMYWKNFFKKMVLVPGVVFFLKKCRGLNIKICIVSDLTTKIQFEKISFLKLGKYIDFVVTSEEAGAEKPLPFIFELALKKLNLTKDEVAMIGDHHKKDVEGAKSFGIKNVYQIS